jgi:predicted amidohydrolase
MTGATLQFPPAFLDIEGNLAALARHFSAVDADVAVVPELPVTGYFFASRAQLLDAAMRSQARTLDLYRSTASERGMIVVGGLAEREGDAVYNAAAAAFPDGRLEMYRKVHLFAGEKALFTPGDGGFPVWEHAGLRLGIMICYDWRFPEAARTLALRGAHVIAHPSDLVASPSLWQPVLRARAIENRVYLLTADRSGTERQGDETLVFQGCSQIVEPGGEVLAEAGATEEGWLTAVIDPARAARKRFSEWNDIFEDRRPETYDL